MTSYNDKKQFFASQISCKFNLRKPKSNKPTNVYCIIRTEDKVYYFATKLKVIPQHWNKKKQLAEVSNFLSALDNQNNSILNARIEQYKERVKEYIDYLCKNPNEEVTPKKFIYKDMKGENILASTLIEQSYLILLKTSNWGAGTERDNRVKKDAIIKYLEAKGNSIDLLSQKGLNDYQEYLEEESNTGNKYINQKCRFFAKLVNDVLHINNKFLDYNIPTVSYRPLITVREKEESSNFPLSNEELDKLRNCKGLTKKEQYYRDIFLLQCACGLRVSDLKSFLEGDYKLEDGIYNYTAQKNKKSGGFKLLEEEDTLLLQKLQKEGKGIKKNYNKYLKSAAKKAGLDALHTYTNDKGEKTKYPKYDMITSHCARHTFVTKMRLEKGMSDEQIATLIGDSVEMISETYGHFDDLNTQIKIKKIYNPTDSPLRRLFSLGKLKEVMGLPDWGRYSSTIYDDWAKDIKDASLLNAAEKYWKAQNTDYKNRFRKALRKLEKIVYECAKDTNDTTLFINFLSKAMLFEAYDEEEIELLPLRKSDLLEIWEREREEAFSLKDFSKIKEAPL